MNNDLLTIKNYNIFNKENNELLVSVPDLVINKGDAVFIIGNNGSGKSTIVKALFSPFNTDDYFYINSDSSAILNSKYGFDLQLNNQKKIDINQSLQSIVYISQDESFGRYDSIYRSLEIQADTALYNLGLRKNQEKVKTLKELLETYSLTFFDDIYKYDKKYKNELDIRKKRDIALKILKRKKAIDCSGGQQKIISILSGLIKALVINVDIIVLDEPLNHLDHKNKLKIVNLITEIRKEKEKNDKVTMIIISHCLVFPFINDNDCIQYKINNNELNEILDSKIFHNCLLYQS